MKEDTDSKKWFNVEYVPKDYIFPKEERPENLDTPVCDSIPVIDLSKSKSVETILMASRELGFFQVINHGIPEKIVTDAMSVLKEFFDMPSKDRTGIVPHKKGYIYTNSTDYAKDGVHLWRENIKHPCHPLEECIHLWPEKPTRYQEVIGAYLKEIQKLSSRILEMICEGLGLEPGYLEDTSEVSLLSSNLYPPCPDPSLTLGILPHQDPSLITLLYQGNSTGLQVMKDSQWINVGDFPNAFVVNIGNQLEIISNGKLRSIKHRVVTSTHETRISIATFVNPSPDCIIEPAKVLVNELEPSRYTASQYKEYVKSSKAYGDYTVAIQNALHS
ncbi:Non-heme dioxygenase N-terminal domain-containing protein [Artemisia annua]|uniref:Non-heme dioxygenase N-terminal domain-containing protein n=1 Tax=Artemisia annua TaxID=35608 RepID=A0A2U1LT61_ARTAN|nr:Non-heme dioxygenase N-terminal domain-containing protein [Artemisia annua]PWA93519.1 Non-heme dioxygenase N-terminal domain-containing protein [Artemisia annua]